MLQKQTDRDLLLVWKRTEVDSKNNRQVYIREQAFWVIRKPESTRFGGSAYFLIISHLSRQQLQPLSLSAWVHTHCAFICHYKRDLLFLANASSLHCQQENTYMRNDPYVKVNEFIRVFFCSWRLSVFLSLFYISFYILCMWYLSYCDLQWWIFWNRRSACIYLCNQ